MIKLENLQVCGFEPAIRGMRNPLNSWDRSDTTYCSAHCCEETWQIDLAQRCGGMAPFIGENDMSLMKRLIKAGSDHRKFMRMIVAYFDITAPLYWWKEYDTYKVGNYTDPNNVLNSCSTMHTIHKKPFTFEDFSIPYRGTDIMDSNEAYIQGVYQNIINALNEMRDKYLETGDKKYWNTMIQMLPESYNQKRTAMVNYETLLNMYFSRKNHKLQEWRDFCNWIRFLPYSELITEAKKWED